MISITIKELLESGVHFGHQTRRWNPMMEEYIFEVRNKIHIIDIRKSLRLLKEALEFIDRKSTRLNSSHIPLSRMPSSA